MDKDRYGYGTQMKIPSNPFSKYTRENDKERPENLIGMTSNPSSLNLSEINTSEFDPSDMNQVKEMQKSLGVKEDGIFGPVTESAYKNMVNKRRQSQGLDEYQYENLEQSQLNQNEGWGMGEPWSPNWSYNYEVNHPLFKNEDSSKSLWSMLRGLFN